jgi:hypothetical protein
VIKELKRAWKGKKTGQNRKKAQKLKKITQNQEKTQKAKNFRNLPKNRRVVPRKLSKNNTKTGIYISMNAI